MSANDRANHGKRRRMREDKMLPSIITKVTNHICMHMLYACIVLQLINCYNYSSSSHSSLFCDSLIADVKRQQIYWGLVLRV